VGKNQNLCLEWNIQVSLHEASALLTAVNEFTSLLHLAINYNCKKTQGSDTVDEQLPHHYKVKGSGPTTPAGTGKEQIPEEKVQL
jgi:hypothetical protein